MVQNSAEILMLKNILNHTAPVDVVLRLYSNNRVPAEGDTVGDYTETTVSGYSAATLTGSSWSIATVSGVTTATYAAQTFTFTAAAAIYGYLVTSAGALFWSERFQAAPITLPAGGGTIVVTPTISLE